MILAVIIVGSWAYIDRQSKKSEIDDSLCEPPNLSYAKSRARGSSDRHSSDALPEQVQTPANATVSDSPHAQSSVRGHAAHRDPFHWRLVLHGSGLEYAILERPRFARLVAPPLGV